MERRHQIGLDSYDRFFPSQDTMPKGGFGNLIALPLQRGPAEKGNSVFVNEAFESYPDSGYFYQHLKKSGWRKWKPLSRRLPETEPSLASGSVWPDDGIEEDPWTLPPSRKKKEKTHSGTLPETVR